MPVARTPAPAPVDPGRAAGLAIHNAIGAATPTIARAVLTAPVLPGQTSIGDIGGMVSQVPGFLGGLLGSSGSATDATPITPPVTAAGAGAAALAAGKAVGKAAGEAATNPAPAAPAAPQSLQTQLGDKLAAILANHPTFDQIRGVAAALPGAVKIPVSNKDQVFGQTSALYDAMYQKGLADAAKVNPVDSPEYAKAFDKLTQTLAQQKANLISNDQHLAAAQLLTPQDQ